MGERDNPLHCIEVMTLDSMGKVIRGHEAKEGDKSLQLPFKSVGRIYTTNANATGFACRSNNGEIVVVTCRHAYNTPFDLFSDCNYYITFSMKHCHKRDKTSLHSDHPVYRRLRYIEKAFNLFEFQSDPITNSLYSIANDVALFELENICICGTPVMPFNDDPIEICNFIPLERTKCVLLGYPGPFLLESVTLIDPIDGKDKIKETMKKNKLVWTEGVVLNVGDLLAISNSSVPGMSGSPILAQCDTGQWKAFGILLGGPAVFGHFHLYRLAEYYDNDYMCSQIIKEIEGLLLHTSDSLAYTVLSLIKTAKNTPKSLGASLLKVSYYSLLNYKSALLRPEEKMLLLNHNLALPLAFYNI